MVDTDFEAKVGVEVISIILIVAIYKGGTLVEVTYRIKGLAINIAEIIYDNSLKSTISITRKAASLYNTL
jgi:hypothetical protein